MIIKSKKFLLRPFRKSDLANLVANINDPAISRNTSNIPYPYTLKAGRAWLKQRLKDQNSRRPIKNFAIVIDGEVAGGIGFHNLVEHRAEIGYWLAHKYWGQGIMTKAVKEVTGYGFTKLNLKRISAKVYESNPPSMRVLKKNGFQLEGILRKFVKKGGRYLNSHLYAKVK